MIRKSGKVAYIVSCRLGLEAFVYTELECLERLGIDFTLYTTKYNLGPYMPKENWNLQKIKIFSLIISQPLFLLRKPAKYISLLFHSLKFGSVFDFLIATYYSDKMISDNVFHIHCQMGDHKFFIGYYITKLTGISLSVAIHAHELYEMNPNKSMFRCSLNFAKLTPNGINVESIPKDLK